LSVSVPALKTIEKGRWQVRELDGVTASASVCIGDPSVLLRFEHRAGSACTVEVIESAAASATVQYSCNGRGFGHSYVRVATPRTVRVDTQGLSQGKPFSYRLEAQRVGAC
jgi:hypothetical protein